VPGAQVDRIAELERLKEALVAFVEHARVALGSAEMEFGRLSQWIEHEAPYAWQQLGKQATEDIAVGKAALFRKRLQRTDGHIPDTSEEEEQLKRSHRRAEEAASKLEACRKWRRRLAQAWSEYQGPANTLADQVAGEPPDADRPRPRNARLDRRFDGQSPRRPAAPRGTERAARGGRLWTLARHWPDCRRGSRISTRFGRRSPRHGTTP
jgi:hypothetical protein